MRRLSSNLGCILCLTWLAACSSHNKTGGPTLEELRPQIASAVCAEVEGCTGSAFLGIALGGMDCEANTNAQLEDEGFATLSAAIDAGTVHYHADLTDACLGGVAKLGCDVGSKRLSSIAGCEGVFEGMIAVGDDCDVDEACTGDAYCKRNPGECPGKCAQRGEVGAACSKDDHCQNDLTCSDADKCERPARENEACGGSASPACGLGSVCNDSAPTKAGVCVKISVAFAKPEGAVCDLGTAQFCQPELSCIASLSGSTASFACAKKVASGAACHFGAPTQCPDAEYCNADIAMGKVEGACLALPVAGETCLVPMAGASSCAPGLSCGGDNHCRKLGRLGEACTEAGDCASDYCKQGKCATDTCAL